jgi:hypothetical protein
MKKGNERLYPVMRVVWLSALVLVLTVGGCGTPSSSSISLTLSSGTALLLQDGTPASVNVTIGRSAGNTKSVTLTVTGLPSGLQLQFVQPGAGATGTVTVSGGANVPAGTYSVNIRADDGGSTASQTLSIVVGIVAAVGNTMDVNSGVGGKLQQFMGEAFQPGSQNDAFFLKNWDTRPLEALGAQHNRVQVQSPATPMKANTGQASDWDFTELDATVQPLLRIGDQSPSFQIAYAPDFLNVPGNAGPVFTFNTANLNTFAQYCANLVRYYNTGGFDWGGQHFQSPSSNHITWWAIYNEYFSSGLTPSEYVQLYNTVVPAMQAVDPTIKFSAIETSFADEQHCSQYKLPFDCSVEDPMNNLPVFVAAVNSGGVRARVDALGLHMYSTCKQADADAELLATVPLFAKLGGYSYQELKTRPDLANVRVWATENNVNSDFNRGDGMSLCNGTQFVSDPRGTSAFFAAWKPYIFSQLGKTGVQGLIHWNYAGDIQYGVVDLTTGNKYLSYWVNYFLQNKFPWDGVAPGPDILALNATETSTVEILATKNGDNSVVVMLANHAVHSPNDNNGPGDPRTILLDVSALGTFTSASQITIDANSNPASGPVEVAIAPVQRIHVTLAGYGVTFVTLIP